MNNKKIRIAIVGSALGGGASQIIDALLDNVDYEPIGIFDSNLSSLHQLVLGVEVVDTSDKIVHYFQQNFFDAVVIAIGSDLHERARLFNQFKLLKIPFINVIDKTVQMRSDTKIGVGNVLLGGVYLGPHVVIGDNCYIINNTSIQHHSIIGNHCYFSTSVALAGRVFVGDRVRFDTCSGAKANISVGENSLISAGCILTENIPSNSIVEPPVYNIKSI